MCKAEFKRAMFEFGNKTIISGFKNGRAEVIHFFIEGEREGILCRDTIDLQGRILKREPIMEEGESVDDSDYDDCLYEYNERDVWDAMTDGMYGDMPDGFDDDYSFLGH